MTRASGGIGRAGRVPRLIVAISLVAVGLVPAALASAQSSEGDGDRTRRIAELEGLLGELSEEEAEALRDLETVRTARQALDAELRQLEADIAASQARLGEIERELDLMTAQYLDFDRQRQDTESDLREARRRFASAAVALYQSGGAMDRAAGILVLDAPTPMVIEVGTTYLARISGDRRDAVRELDDLTAAFEDLLAATETGREAARAARAQAEAERDRLDGLALEEQAKRNALAHQEALEAEIVSAIRARQVEFEEELAALRVTSNAITEMLRQIQADQTRSTSFSISRPVPGAITSAFGVRVHPILGTTRMHNGIDMSGAYGSAILSAAPGDVVWTGPRDGYGNTVIIDHGNQYATLYAHMSQIWIDTGDTVAVGDQLGAVGATGLATGPHLHFEVRLLGSPVDPLNYLT